ncbi:MAG: amidophosphoribosyltransferase, partial [Oscillospiraceae bacterium]|nr:amidophosphoribosyltransferase [Oscillospiraceae bacterium]
HAIGYANRSGLPFARPVIKYTPTWPRSFTPQEQSIRNLIARMKLVPVNAQIEKKRLLFVEDSIVRGTQLGALMDFLRDYGPRELHVRSACPPILYSCKYLNFTRSTSEDELISHRAIAAAEPGGEKYIADCTDCNSRRYKKMVELIRKELKLATLGYHSIEGLTGSIGIDKCKLCTYCLNGKE